MNALTTKTSLGALALMGLVMVTGCEEYEPALTFSVMEVLDDKELGEGDWKVVCEVDGEPAFTQVGEAGTGEALGIRKTFEPETKADSQSLEVTCSVFELDSGTAKFVGEVTKTHDFTASAHPFGGHEMLFNNAQGSVRLNYALARRPDTMAQPDEGEEVKVRLHSLRVLWSPEFPDSIDTWRLDCAIDGQHFAIADKAGIAERISIEKTFAGLRHRAAVVHCGVRSQDGGELEHVGIATNLHEPFLGLWPGGEHTLQFMNDEGALTLVYSLEQVNEDAIITHQPTVVLTSLFIADDMEAGEGDWEVNCSIDGDPIPDLPLTGEAGTGESVTINRTLNLASDGDFQLACSVREKDGAVFQAAGSASHLHVEDGGLWPLVQQVGPEQVTTANANGAYQFHFKTDEGDVRLNYFVFEGTDDVSEPVNVEVKQLHVFDDKEIGSGDWKVLCSVDGTAINGMPHVGEAGTGETLQINKSLTVDAAGAIGVFCQVHEKDSSEWEFVGETGVILTKGSGGWPTADQFFTFHNDEGKVQVKWRLNL